MVCDFIGDDNGKLFFLPLFSHFFLSPRCFYWGRRVGEVERRGMGEVESGVSGDGRESE